MEKSEINIDVENRKREEKEIENEKRSKKFWIYFWSTIVVLAIVYIGLNITATTKFSELPKVDREAKIESMLNEFKQRFPEFIQITQSLNKQSIEQIKQNINNNVDKAYDPLYNQIDSFSEFHYSLRGEYTELGTVILGDVSNILNEELFDPADFENELSDSLKVINNKSLNIIKEQFESMKEEIQKKMKLNDEEINFLFSEILKFSQNDMLERFSGYTNMFFKGMGLGAGATAGAAAMATKAVSKKVSQVIAKKIITKAAIKGATKAAGAAAGAATGGTSGLLCGPGAWLCSPVGAVVGGVVGWFTTDKIVVEIDQHYNEDEFKEDIKNLIDIEKENTKKTLYKIYIGSLRDLEKETNKSLDSIKNKTIKDIIVSD